MKKLFDILCCIALACSLVFGVRALATAAGNERGRYLQERVKKAHDEYKKALKRYEFAEMAKKCNIPLTLRGTVADNRQITASLEGVSAFAKGNAIYYSYSSGKWKDSNGHERAIVIVIMQPYGKASFMLESAVFACKQLKGTVYVSPEIKDIHTVCVHPPADILNIFPDGRMAVQLAGDAKDLVEFAKSLRIPKKSEIKTTEDCGDLSMWKKLNPPLQ